MDCVKTWCRLCGSSSSGIVDIFTPENELFFKITTFMPVKIIKDDPLPQKICEECSRRVDDLYRFCTEAVDVQLRLTTLINMQNSMNNCFKDDNSTSSTSKEVPLRTALDIKQEQFEPIQIEIDMSHIKDNYSDCSPATQFVQTFHTDSSDDVSLTHLKDQKRKKKKKTKIKQEQTDAMPVFPYFDCNGIKTEVLDEVPLYCCICFEKVEKRDDMIAHYKNHATKVKETDWINERDPKIKIEDGCEGNNFQCTKCEKWFPTLEIITKHLKEHKSTRPFRCTLCEKSFKEVNAIMKHGKTHDFVTNGDDTMKLPIPQPRFMCDQCDQTFVFMKTVLDHRAEMHPEAPKDFINRCMICRREFNHLNSLRRHLRSHTGERNYLCNICGKKLVSREHLKFHINIHAGYKPYACKTCGKAFVKKCNLILHERVHSGEKPHVCSQCGKGFSQRSTLVIHERYHTGARPYACEFCGKAFVARGLLTMHLKAACGINNQQI